MERELEVLNQKLKWLEDLLAEPYVGSKTYGNDDKYVGNLVNNNRSGKGVYTWASGDKY